MPKKHGGLLIDPDFVEDEVGYFLTAYLTLVTAPLRRYSIIPFSKKKETETGADVLLQSSNPMDEVESFLPFYMQFKRPFAYPENSKSKIVIDRKDLNLPVSPHSLFFPLREKRPNQQDFQHNILFDLRKSLLENSLGDATYICPLFLQRERFWNGLYDCTKRHRPFPFYPDELIDIYIGGSETLFKFGRIPIFVEHISIPPHDRVGSAKHKYSFDGTGNGICFHSPQSLPEGSQTLAAFLKEMDKKFEESRISLEMANDTLLRLWRESGSLSKDTEPYTDNDNPINSWLSWGEMLRTKYKIEQFAFVQWKWR